MTREIVHHANYIIREGSKDLGSTTLEGSRSGMSMLIYSGLKIIGRQGYQLLIDQGIEKARLFAAMIEDTNNFEIITEPELNILTYRFIPDSIKQQLRSADQAKAGKINQLLNELNDALQKIQRERGVSFVSRTTLTPARFNGQGINVLRVVLANPLTTEEVLRALLTEQQEIVTVAHLDESLKSVR
jgi:glutamate decarboxylase